MFELVHDLGEWRESMMVTPTLMDKTMGFLLHKGEGKIHIIVMTLAMVMWFLVLEMLIGSLVKVLSEMEK